MILEQTPYTCPRCHQVTLSLPHLSRILCGRCGHTIVHDFPIARAQAAIRAAEEERVRKLELADTQELPVV